MNSTYQPTGSHLLLVRFSHAIFAVPFTFIGFFLATENSKADFTWNTFFLVLLCMILARNAARNFNRYMNRGITSNAINYRAALVKVIIYSLLFIATTYFINELVFKLSPLALILISSYAFSKRSTVLSHFILGINFSLVPVGAYLSVTGIFDLLPVLFSLIILCWISGFDILYAIVNKEFYIEKKIKSLPLLIGTSRSRMIAIFMHVVAAMVTIFVGQYAEFGRWYGIGLLIFIGLLFYQYLIIANETSSNTSFLFLICNSLTGLLYAAFTVLDLFYK